MSKSTLGKWWKKLGFCYKRRNKKMCVYQNFHIDIVPPDSTTGFFLRICKSFQSWTLLKWRLQLRWFFLWILKFFQPGTLLDVEHLQRATSNGVIIARFFCKTCSLKWKIKESCFFKNFYVSFNIFNESEDSSHITINWHVEIQNPFS